MRLLLECNAHVVGEQATEETHATVFTLNTWRVNDMARMKSKPVVAAAAVVFCRLCHQRTDGNIRQQRPQHFIESEFYFIARAGRDAYNLMHAAVNVIIENCVLHQPTTCAMNEKELRIRSICVVNIVHVMFGYLLSIHTSYYCHCEQHLPTLVRWVS